MTSRAEAFRDLYSHHRIEHQQQFLEQRRDELRESHRQSMRLRNGLLLLAGLVGGAAQAFTGTPRGVCGVIAATLAALAGAVSGYSTLMGFSVLSQSYADALHGVRAAGRAWRETTTENPGSGSTSADSAAALLLVEDVLRTENGQWGQLVLRQADRPASPEVTG